MTGVESESENETPGDSAVVARPCEQGRSDAVLRPRQASTLAPP